MAESGICLARLPPRPRLRCPLEASLTSFPDPTRVRPPRTGHSESLAAGSDVLCSLAPGQNPSGARASPCLPLLRKPVSGALLLLLSPAHQPRPEDGPGPAMRMLAGGPACVSVRIKILLCICKKDGEPTANRCFRAKEVNTAESVRVVPPPLLQGANPSECAVAMRRHVVVLFLARMWDMYHRGPSVSSQSHPAGNAPRGVLVNTGGTSKCVLGVGQSGCLTV